MGSGSPDAMFFQNETYSGTGSESIDTGDGIVVLGWGTLPPSEGLPSTGR